MRQTNNTKRAFGYIRVSTATQAREGESLAVQEELLRAICKIEGLDLISVFEEEAVSASKPLASRPKGRALLDQLQAGDTVIALRLDRLFRNTADALSTLAALKRRGVALYLKDTGGYVLGDSVGELVFSLMSAVASFERNRTRERIIDVKQSLARQGRYAGGDAPFGHRVVERDGLRYIEADEFIIGQVKALKRQGYSSRLMAGRFAQLGIDVSHVAVARCVKRLAL